MNGWRAIIAVTFSAVIAASCSDDGAGRSGLQPSADGSYRFEGATDCSTDVTVALNQFIADVPDGATISFAADACHRIDDTVEVVEKQGLTFDGNNASFKALEEGDGGRKHWEFTLGGDFTIRHLTVVGANPNGGPDGYVAEFASQHGFNFQGVSGVDIVDIAVTDVYGDFLRFGKNTGEDNRETTDVTVVGSRFERSGRQGVSFAAASDVVIQGNTFDGVGRSVFDIEPNSSGGGAQRVRLADNDLSAWGNLVLPVGGKGEVLDIELVGNRLHGKQLDVLVKDIRDEKKDDGGGVRRKNISIIGNVSDTPSRQTAVNLSSVDGAIVRDNVQPFVPSVGAVALRITQSCDVTIEGNDFDGVQTIVEQDDFPCP